jgi:hypothetical protein
MVVVESPDAADTRAALEGNDVEAAARERTKRGEACGPCSDNGESHRRNANPQAVSWARIVAESK